MPTIHKKNFRINRDGVQTLTVEWASEATFLIDGTEVARAGLQELKKGVKFTAPNGTSVEVIANRGLFGLQFGVFWNSKVVMGTLDPSIAINFSALIVLLFGISNLLSIPVLHYIYPVVNSQVIAYLVAGSAGLIFLAIQMHRKSILALRLFGILLVVVYICSLLVLFRNQFNYPMMAIFNPIYGSLFFLARVLPIQVIYVLWPILTTALLMQYLHTTLYSIQHFAANHLDTTAE